jgi:hypothetical protein
VAVHRAVFGSQFSGAVREAVLIARRAIAGSTLKMRPQFVCPFKVLAAMKKARPHPCNELPGLGGPLVNICSGEIKNFAVSCDRDKWWMAILGATPLIATRSRSAIAFTADRHCGD